MGMKRTYRFHAGDALPPPSFSEPIFSPRPREWSCASLASPANVREKERSGEYWNIEIGWIRADTNRILKNIKKRKKKTENDATRERIRERFTRTRTFNLFNSSSSFALCFRHSAMYSLSCSSRSLLFCSCLCANGRRNVNTRRILYLRDSTFVSSPS